MEGHKMKFGRIAGMAVAVLGGYVIGNKIADKVAESREVSEVVRAGIIGATSASLSYGMGRFRVLGGRKNDFVIAGAAGAGSLYAKKAYEEYKAKPKAPKNADYYIEAGPSAPAPAPAMPPIQHITYEAPKGVSDWAYVTGQLVQAGATISGAVIGSKGSRMNHYAAMAA